MDQKSVITLEVKKGENNYIFSMPFGAKYGECFDVLSDMLQHILQESQKVAQNVKDVAEKSKQDSSEKE